jgi:quinol monooxygenase YgiN
MEETMVKIIARISARADAAARLRQVLRDLSVATRDEAGCVSYELFQDDDNALDFITIEHWVDDAAAAAHMTTPHVAEAFARAGDLLAQPPLIHRFSQIV